MKRIAIILLMVASFAHADSTKQPAPQRTELDSVLDKYRAKPAQTPAKAKPKKEKPGASIGMTKKQVVNETNWGKPESSRRVVNGDGTWDFWYYNCNTNILTFLDGELTEIETPGD